MPNFIRLTFAALMAFLLFSCGYMVHESGFVQTDWPKSSYYTPGTIRILSKPPTDIGSCCDGGNYTATFGPYAGLPLFVIPNPLWPFTYSHYNSQHAVVEITVSADGDDIDWNAVQPKLAFKGKTIRLDHAEDVST